MPAIVDGKRLKKAEDRRSALVREMNKILASAGDDILTEEQEETYSAFESEMEDVDKIIKREKSLQAAELEMDGTEVVDPHIGNPRQASLDDPMKGFKSSQEFLGKVLDAHSNRAVDDRLKPLAAAGGDEHQTQSDPYGGFLVPEGMSPQLLSVTPEMDLLSQIQSRSTSVPMDSPTVKFNARTDKDHTSSVSGGLTVSRRSEMNAATSSRMQLEQVELNATGLFGLAYATEELLSRSQRSFVALLEAGFRQEFGSTGIQEYLGGTGVAEPEGIKNSPCLISVAKEGSQTADTIVGENLIKMRARVWGYESAIWLANHDTYVQLIQSHIESPNNAGLVALYHQSLQSDRPDTLLGRPIFYSEYMETLGDEFDIACINWTQYLTGTLSPMDSAESVHVRFVNHERTFKFWMENDAKGWWRSALTPKNSSSTLSPFVTLAARA